MLLPEERQALIEENSSRTAAGLGELTGMELGRFKERMAQAKERQLQLSGLADALLENDEQSRVLSDAYQRSGLSGVAKNFRDASRRRAFNMARRGLVTGSADIEAREQQRAATTQQVADTVAQAQAKELGKQLEGLQRIGAYQNQAVAGNPLTQMSDQQDLSQIQNQTNLLLGQASAGLQDSLANTVAAQNYGNIVAGTFDALAPVARGIPLRGTL